MAKRLGKNSSKLYMAIATNILELDRYYQTVLLNLGLKFYLEDHDLNCRFVGSEIDLKSIDDVGKQLRPDMILQSINPKIGFAIEIKTSLSTLSDIGDEVIKMKRYDKELSGWATKNGEIENHKIVFCVYHDDIGRTKQVIGSLVNSKQFNTTKQFFLWDWSYEVAYKLGKRELITIIQESTNDINEPELSKFNRQLKSSININPDDDKISTLSGIVKFTRKEPPVEYTMVELWSSLLPKFCTIQNNFTTTIDIVTNYINSIDLPLMKNTDGHSFKVRKEWIKKAFDMFAEIKLAQKLSDNRYKFFLGTTLHNITQSICRETAKASLKSFRAKKQPKLHYTVKLPIAKDG